jgi:hypothetical protein
MRELWHLCYPALDGLTGGGPGLDPVDRQEGFELFCWRVVHQFFKHPLEVGEGVGTMAAHLFDEGVDDRTAPAGVLAADEHPVLVIMPRFA